jgi:hypothetical protein
VSGKVSDKKQPKPRQLVKYRARGEKQMKSRNNNKIVAGMNSVFWRAVPGLRLLPAMALLAGLCAFANAQKLGQEVQTFMSARDLTVDKHFFDQSSSYCGGDNILFYNESTGEGLVGKVSLGGFRQTQKFERGRFALGWTTVAKVDSINSILFYKSSTGDAALGTLDRGNFSTTQTYNNFSRGWTNILYVGLNNNQALFYNSETSAAALGFAPSKNYRNGDFSAGWTHIVWNNSGTLFYDTNLGSGAIAVPIVSHSPGLFAAPNDLKTTRTFPTGDFTTDWTHVAATKSHVFFYKRSDGSAAIGTLSPSNFETRTQYVPGKFSTQWTHVVSAGEDMLLFYNAGTGSAAIGEIVGNEFRGTASLGPGSLASGFTNLVCSADAPQGPH